MSKTSFRVAATYIGAVMGAGFASGQEILQFFVVYRDQGLLAILLAGALFALFGAGTLLVIRRYKINTYQEMFNLLMGKRLGPVCEVMVTCFLFMGLVIMLSGSGAVFKEYLSLPPTLGILLTTLAVLVALGSKGEGVIWINTVLIPLKLVICLAVSFTVLAAHPSVRETTGTLLVPSRPWFVSALLYVSFNMTFAIVVLASLGREMKGNIQGGILGGVGLGVFALAIGAALLQYYPAIAGFQVPMVHVAFKASSQMGTLYLLVLWFAMITAAVGNAFSFVKRVISLSPVSYNITTLVTLGAAVPLAHFSFSALVGLVYPIFGYIGLAALVPLVRLLFVRT